MTYEPSEDEKRVIAWLRDRAQRHHVFAVSATDDGNDDNAKAHIATSAAYSIAAERIEQGHHRHD